MKKKNPTMIAIRIRGCMYISWLLHAALREDIHTMNYPANFLMMDSDDVETVLKKVYEEANIKLKIHLQYGEGYD